MLAEASCATPGELEAELRRRGRRPLKHFPTKSVFHKYLRGETGPSPEVVDEIGRLLPKAATLYAHPVWPLAEAEELRSSELHRLIVALPKEVALDWTLAQTPGETFWRRPLVPASNMFEFLQDYSGLDRVAIVLAMLHESVLRQDEEANFNAWRAWAAVADSVRRSNVLHVLFPTFFAVVARRARAIRYPSPRLQNHLALAIEIAEEESEFPEFEAELNFYVESRRIEPISVIDFVFLKTLPDLGQLEDDQGDDDD